MASAFPGLQQCSAGGDVILVADGDPGIRRIAAAFLARQGHRVIEARDGHEARALLASANPFLLVADVALAGVSGLTLLEEVRAANAGIEVILLSGHADARAAIHAIKAGAFDFLKKPFLLDELRLAVERAAEHRELRERSTQLRLLQDREELSRKHLIEMMTGLANVIDAKSQYTREHSDRVARYSLELARWLGMPETRLQDMHFGAKLHDIGKVGTPDRILNSTGALSREERQIIMAHPVDGGRILEPIWLMRDIVPMVRLHHESWDGSGYPDGRVGDETPMEARIVKIADYFDAITSNRPYRSPMSFADACQVLENERGRQLDPELTPAFTAMVRAGSLAPRLAGTQPAETQPAGTQPAPTEPAATTR